MGHITWNMDVNKWERQTLKVLTYNIRHARGLDGSVSLDRIAAAIRATGAGLVALQEVDRYRRRSGLVHQARWLGDRLGMDYAFGATIDGPLCGCYGNAVLSRHPLLSRSRYRLPGEGEPRGLIVTRLETPVGMLHFLNTHLGLSAAVRRAQVARVLQVAGRLDGPLILAGDFNCRPDAPELTPVLEMFSDTSCDPQGNLTFPADNPTARIDYVFVSAPLRSTDSGTVDSPASDHLPYYAEITRE